MAKVGMGNQILTLRERFIFALAKLIKAHNVNHAIKLVKLEDRPDIAYIWLVKEGVDIASMIDWISRNYIEHFGREPQAMHIVEHDVMDIKSFTRQEFKVLVQPFLTESVKQAPKRSKRRAHANNRS